MKMCSEPSCDNPVKARGLCNKHYLQVWLAGGFQDRLIASTTEINAFLEYALKYRGKQCLPWPFARNSDGYGIMNDGDGHCIRVHCWICEQIYGPAEDSAVARDNPGENIEVAHSCGKGHEGCINPQHLRWDTHTGNQGDRLIHGTTNRGERNGNSKLHDYEVREILRLWNDGMSKREIARRKGVSARTVGMILDQQLWKHL